MYQHFYGLTQLPFDPSLDGSCFFSGGQRQEILDALSYFTERGEKMVVVTGDIGIGKTALITALQLRLPERITRLQLTGPYLMQQELQDALLSYLSLNVEFGDDRSAILVTYLQQIADTGTPLLLIIDDAHKLSQASLVYLLSLAGVTGNFQQKPLVRLMLFGAPDLSKMLLLLQESGNSDPVAFRARLNAFSADEIFFYLEQRFRCAGYQGEALFDTAVIKAIFNATKGIPRAINSMVDQLLMSCYAKGKRNITVDDIQSLGYQTQMGIGQGFAFDQDHGLLKSIVRLLTKPPIVITAVTSLVVGLSLLAGYVISDYLMINHSTKEGIGKDSIVNSVSIDPPMPESTIPNPTPTDNSSQSNSSITTTEELQPTLTQPKSITPPAKSLQSESLTKNTTAPVQTASKPPSIEKAPTNTVKAETTTKSETSKPETTKAAQQKPTVTPQQATLASNNERPKWPLHNNWKKHHDATLAQIKQLQRNGSTYTIQLLSDTWRSRDAFIELTQIKLNELPNQSAYLVDYVLDDGRPRVALIYGIYPSLEAAQAAVAAFPEKVAHYKPMLKRLDSVVLQMQGFTPTD